MIKTKILTRCFIHQGSPSHYDDLGQSGSGDRKARLSSLPLAFFHCQIAAARRRKQWHRCCHHQDQIE